MKVKKLLITLLLSVICTISFAACGGKNDNSADDLINKEPPVIEQEKEETEELPVYEQWEDERPVYEPEIEEYIANFKKHTIFVDNQVLIFLTEEASFENIFHDYTAEDFPDIGAVSVEEIDGRTNDTSGITYRIRQCLLEEKSGATIPEHLKHHKRTFCITLDKRNEDNVLRAVYILRQRADIYLADPNWLESIDV